MATVALKQYQHYIGGEWVDAAEGATFDSYNPATGEAFHIKASKKVVFRPVKELKEAI